MFTTFFGPGPVSDYDSAVKSNSESKGDHPRSFCQTSYCPTVGHMDVKIAKSKKFT
jgi:hypothetical protein